MNRRQNAIKGNVLDSYLSSNNLNKGDRGKLIDMQNDLNEFLKKKSAGDFNYFFRILLIKKHLIDDVIN